MTEMNHAIEASRMTYAVDGRQLVAIALGANVLSFAAGIGTPSGGQGTQAEVQVVAENGE